ncbi:MAG: PH domain-containing protein [Planctomycetota bacterium]
MTDEKTILEAKFNPKVCTYWLLSGVVVLVLTIFGIPLILLWLPIGLAVTRRYLDSMECVLTEKALKVKKGILVRVEKTIPLEKITDMGMVQGPIMRAFDLHTLTVETAGQSGQGALVSLTGILDAKSFRETVLSQRDTVSSAPSPIVAATSTQANLENSTPETIALLTEIRDSMHRIESELKKSKEG